MEMAPAKASTKPVRLFLQENLDAQGRQIPVEEKVHAIIRFFERETGVRFEPIILPWKRAQVETLNGYGVIYGFSRSVERMKQYHFSQALITEKVWAITYGRPKPAFKSVEDLRGKVISIGRGFSHGLEFDQARGTVFTVEEDSASTAARFKKIVAKRSDLMLWPVRNMETSKEVEDYVNKVLIPQASDLELQNKIFDVSDKPMFYDTVHFASAKGKYEDVISKIDKAIERGMRSGELQRVLKGYH
ncbi:ABC transporter substrate-binding protein [Undibacterium cyanobacteriorum]|uniref:ABC transporter substrate-binding protein n=1 Tax=Undibacterium cyanobacteriorum TaxID=3073561 RepID=A0ABY9RM16_9BURK|nr:ABC transporter substrate-binding protein [Undibacterium sp. 20NA77.5]WMW81729.1 ABC transporter substrate-binding protein [Undibacterium sp. 20NA77.5]